MSSRSRSYLAKALEGHTTLLISAEQVGALSEYMTLARLLQASIVVMEDVELIARDRSAMSSACEETLLNRLLNEMDGLKENADALFILTTNRPEALEQGSLGATRPESSRPSNFRFPMMKEDESLSGSTRRASKFRMKLSRPSSGGPKKSAQHSSRN